MNALNSENVRPILILDADTIRRNSIFFEHFFVALADDSISSAVICPPACDTSAILSPAVDLIHHPACRIPFLGRYNKDVLLERVKAFSPTVVHCVGKEHIPLCRKIANEIKVPYILTARGMDKLKHSDILDPMFAAVIVPCESIGRYFSSKYPLIASRIEKVEIGAFVEDGCACFSKQQRLPSIIVVRPLEKAADFEPLLSALKHLAINGCEFAAAIIGSGKAESQIRKTVWNTGLSQIVSIVPEFNPLRAVLSESDIFIQPRPTNAFSVPLLEAMSVGMAVAGCKGGVDDLLIGDKTAMIFDPEDYLSIYNVIQRLLDDKIGSQQLACSAQSYLRQHHRVSKMISGLLGVYRKAGDKFS